MNLIDRVYNDVRLVGALARTALAVGSVRATSNVSFADKIEERVDAQPDRIALIQGDREITYAELDAMANRFARWARSRGVGHGDVVALLLGNRPETPAAWLGLAKIGAVSALLNHHLRGRALAHCVGVSGARIAVVHDEFAEPWSNAEGEIEDAPAVFSLGDEFEGAEPLDAVLLAQSEKRLDRALRSELQAGDDFLYIYTSGTTGLPKAAKISHLRAISMTQAGVVGLNLGPEDRGYIALPLYHSAGGVMALGGSLLSGGSSVIAPKFSASEFFSDCERYGVTYFQYIGELCRYLLATPAGPSDRSHRIRGCIGNGLRPEVWGPFQERFGIDKIIEFYGATEGNVAIVNFEGKVGSIGRMPPLLRSAMGVALVQYDVERDEHPRSADGFCIPCAPDEPGEALGRISSVMRFEGYTDERANSKKILKDVFSKGDAYFRTGDLLRFDEDSYFYFVDRIGDTFRWKGENVATSEVAEALSHATGVLEVNVYGVEVPGSEGRAGMAALVVDESFDPKLVHELAGNQLPSYARPLFLRIRNEIETTGTFKHRKVDLAKDGFDPAATSDPLWFSDSKAGTFVPLDPDCYAEIVSGRRRL